MEVPRTDQGNRESYRLFRQIRNSPDLFGRVFGTLPHAVNKKVEEALLNYPRLPYQLNLSSLQTYEALRQRIIPLTKGKPPAGTKDTLILTNQQWHEIEGVSKIVQGLVAGEHIDLTIIDVQEPHYDPEAAQARQERTQEIARSIVGSMLCRIDAFLFCSLLSVLAIVVLIIVLLAVLA